MRKFLILSVLALVVLFVSCSQKVSQENYTVEVFTQKYEASKNENEISTLCQNFMENAEDINILRKVQSIWIDIDEKNANAFSKELAESITFCKFSVSLVTECLAPATRIIFVFTIVELAESVTVNFTDLSPTEE